MVFSTGRMRLLKCVIFLAIEEKSALYAGATPSAGHSDRSRYQ